MKRFFSLQILMRILHTSDWHFGKYLGEYPRLIEQEAFSLELAQLADDHKIDLILVAGDIYDFVNPPASAEQLFFNTMKNLSNGGRRPIILVAGNHDNPSRLTASSSLVTEMGIIMFGIPGAVIPVGDYNYFSIKDSGEGFVELEISGERAIILAMPYPSEKRLNEILGSIGDEHGHQQSYSERVGEIFTRLSEKYRPDTVNLAIGHFYVNGGQASGSERDISLGGGYAVSPDALPKNAGYIALGHLHRPQQVGSTRAFYSGSPIAYDISESHYAKCVYIAQVSPGFDCPASIEKAYLKCYKPFVTINASSVNEAIDRITTESDNCWLTVKIKSNQVLGVSEAKEIRKTNRDILEILCIPDDLSESETTNILLSSDSGMNTEKEFISFYTEKRGFEPSKEIIELFMELIGTTYEG